MKRLALLAIGLAVLASPVRAADNIRFIVPYAAGGPMDQIARILQPGLSKVLGETVIVDTRPGAGGMIGTNALATSAPDGKTISLGSQGSHVLNSLTQKAKLPYDPIKSFTPIAIVGTLPAVLVARKDLEADNLKELIELAKKKKINFASSGVGNSPHLAGELINRDQNLKMGHIPYSGMGPALVDVMAGTVDFAVADIPVVVQHVKSGALKAIAVFGPERAKVLPDVPTSVEQGYPNLVTGNYYFVLAPAGISKEVQKKLEDSVIKAAQLPEVAERLAAAGLGKPADSEALDKLIKSQLAKWEPFVRDLNLVAK